jgi:hypothetical protein
VSRRWALLALAAGATGCAARSAPPPAPVLESARALSTYSAELRAKVGGLGVPRLTVLVGFARPDRLRFEIPGPAGVRLIAVAHAGVLTAVFPVERAVYEGEAEPRVLAEVLGVALAPKDVMDFLVGTSPASVQGYRADWGPALPRRVRGRLDDGTRLDVHVNDPISNPKLAAAAFTPPPHEGYRWVTAGEARALWTGGRQR